MTPTKLQAFKFGGKTSVVVKFVTSETPDLRNIIGDAGYNGHCSETVNDETGLAQSLGRLMLYGEVQAVTVTQTVKTRIVRVKDWPELMTDTQERDRLIGR